MEERRGPDAGAEHVRDGPTSSLAPVELRRIVDEVRTRLDDLVAASEQLRELLDAVVSISTVLDLPDVLRKIVDAGVRLTGAQYGALGVLDPDDPTGLSEFIHVGIDEAEARQIGHLPRGLGVLGVLVSDPKPLRLADIADHPASYGFPPNHPKMEAFLGVPVMVRDSVFGNLYLAKDPAHGAFTEHDEQTVVSLAAAAGLAIDNSRMYGQVQRGERWLRAISVVTRQLLEGTSSSAALASVARHARALAGGDFAMIATKTAGGALLVEAADGQHSEDVIGERIPAGSLSDHVLASGHTESVADTRTDPRVWNTLLDRARVTAGIFVPLISDQGPLGTLVIGKRAESGSFTAETVQMVESFSAQAAIAVALGSAAENRDRLAVYEDRDRIARDLHDLVIQRLFAAAMMLQSVVPRLADEPTSRTVLEVVDDLDATIRQIRSTIFALDQEEREASGMRTEIVDAVSGAAKVLGHAPTLRMSGPLDSAVGPAQRAHALAVLREALSNVARHAGAHRVEVDVVVDDFVTGEVADDGVGMGGAAVGNGLRNMHERARELSGTCSVESPESGGTRVRWRVPLSQ